MVESECINAIIKYMGAVQDIKIALHISITHRFGKEGSYLVDKKDSALKELRDRCGSPNIKDII